MKLYTPPSLSLTHTALGLLSNLSIVVINMIYIYIYIYIYRDTGKLICLISISVREKLYEYLSKNNFGGKLDEPRTSVNLSHHNIYIYIYRERERERGGGCVCVCVTHRETVSLYQNFSVWLETQDASSWDRNPPNLTLGMVSNRSAILTTYLSSGIITDMYYLSFVGYLRLLISYRLYTTITGRKISNSNRIWSTTEPTK